MIHFDVALIHENVSRLIFSDVNWGSSTQVQVYKTALTNAQQFCNIDDHTKTYTPQILVMTGLPNMRPSLVDFAYLLCKNNSLMVCGDVLKVLTFNFFNSVIVFIVMLRLTFEI